MLTVRLDEETEQQLGDILAHEKDTNRSELIKRLIRDRASDIAGRQNSSGEKGCTSSAFITRC